MLVDTSVWVSYLRADGSQAHRWMAEQVRDPEAVSITEPIIMELLAGASRGTGARLEPVLAALPVLSVRPDTDFRNAGLLAGTARAAGLSVRSIVDCLIASVALRRSVGVAHRDADYAALAQVSPLAVTDLR